MAGHAHVGDVALLDVDLDRAATGLPAPSITTMSNSRRRRSRALTTTSHNWGPRGWWESVAAVDTGLPITTTCVRPSVSGLSRTGFISTWAGTPAADA
ncbi:MAG: hypothetical protein OXH72_12310 [Caldilineaceae bacterium]|nr:hypothetical protein [Caldilineaceae bacterium]